MYALLPLCQLEGELMATFEVETVDKDTQQDDPRRSTVHDRLIKQDVVTKWKWLVTELEGVGNVFTCQRAVLMFDPGGQVGGESHWSRRPRQGVGLCTSNSQSGTKGPNEWHTV
eukprot:GFUD01067703.1.p1 GENE.GFUD01067703.1~~GFUD01067703.1.p1  ORF type:complete len:114 (+),score=28.06 GFUD01067703.1:112-453(+)